MGWPLGYSGHRRYGMTMSGTPFNPDLVKPKRLYLARRKPKLTREQLSKIAKGKDVKLKIGDIEFKLTPEHIKMFANLLALSDPASS